MSLILDGTAGLFGNVTGGNISGTFTGGNSSATTAIATGSTTARSLANRFADVVNVLDFGADPTGTVDSQPAIQAAINSGEGKFVFIPKGTYKIQSTINISKQGVNLIGSSSAQNVFANSEELGSTLKWAGGANPCISINIGGGIQGAISGGSIKQLKIDANNLATNCLKTESLMAYRFEDLKLVNSTIAAWDLTGREPYSAGFNDVYQAVISNVSIVVSGLSKGIYSGITSVTGPETTGEHPAFCQFTCIHITHENGIALHLQEADDCSFTNLGISRVSGGTGDGIVLDGSGVHGNHFRCVNSPSPIKAINGSNCNYMELAGIDYNISPTIDLTSELFYIYLGRNGVSNQAKANLPAIKFPNTTFSSGGPNYLHYFEQDDWTPVITFDNNSTGIVYSIQYGKYQRVGYTIHASARVTLTNKGSSTGTARLGGLPFPSNSIFNSVGLFMPVSGFAGSFGSGTYLDVIANTNTAVFRGYTSGAVGVTALTDANFTNSSSFILQISYQIL